jgi:protein SCO1/2
VRPRIAGEFELLDAAGKTVRWADINGRWQLVFFGFTHCPEACPTTLANASLALADPGLDGRDLRVLFISVDPGRDTAEIVGNYVGKFGPRVTGLTGDPAGIASAAAAFGVFFEKMPAMADGEYMVNHTATLFLLGPTDEILETIPYGAAAPEIADAVKRHL